MPNLIRDGRLVEEDWRGRLLTLEEANAEGALEGGDPVGILLEPDQPPSAIDGELSRIDLIAINFPAFTDGRGFSYARALREQGYRGEIRAIGHIIRDQLQFLQRCGFNAFELPEDVDPEAALASLEDFSEAYQADVLQKEPLFRRR